MPEIVLADPSLVVLVGAAGAGKTTFAARHFEPDEVLSSDAYRALIAGDESDQRATRAAFGRLNREVERRLAAGRLTVIDATSVEPYARRTLLLRATAANVPATAIVLDLPAGLVIRRNAGRTSRVVAEDVVRRHLARLRESLDGDAPPIRTEGFADVLVLREPGEVDAVTVRRVRALG